MSKIFLLVFMNIVYENTTHIKIHSAVIFLTYSVVKKLIYFAVNAPVFYPSSTASWFIPSYLRNYVLGSAKMLALDAWLAYLYFYVDNTNLCQQHNQITVCFSCTICARHTY
jgi:hypothetical protein